MIGVGKEEFNWRKELDTCQTLQFGFFGSQWKKGAQRQSLMKAIFSKVMKILETCRIDSVSGENSHAPKGTAVSKLKFEVMLTEPLSQPAFLVFSILL